MENGPYERERLGSDYYKVFINLFIYLFIYLFIWLGGVQFLETLLFLVLPLLLYFQPCQFLMRTTGLIFIRAVFHIWWSLFAAASLSIFV